MFIVLFTFDSSDNEKRDLYTFTTSDTTKSDATVSSTARQTCLNNIIKKATKDVYFNNGWRQKMILNFAVFRMYNFILMSGNFLDFGCHHIFISGAINVTLESGCTYIETAYQSKIRNVNIGKGCNYLSISPVVASGIIEKDNISKGVSGSSQLNKLAISITEVSYEITYKKNNSTEVLV